MRKKNSGLEIQDGVSGRQLLMNAMQNARKVNKNEGNIRKLP